MLFAVYVLQPEGPLVIYHSSHDHGDKNGKRRKTFLRYLCCFALNMEVLEASDIPYRHDRQLLHNALEKALQALG